MWFSSRAYAEQIKQQENENREVRDSAMQLEGRCEQLEIELSATRAALAVERQRADGAERTAAIAQNNFEWARVSLNRVEQERATLLSHLLRFPVGAIEIARQVPPMPNEDDSGLPDIRGLDFEDMGDAEAMRHGIAHDADGRVRYEK